MTRLLLVLAGIAAVATSVAGAQNAFPSRIDLPDGFQPEGIAIAGEQFYVGLDPDGSRLPRQPANRRRARYSSRRAGRAAIGMKVDRGRLFVAGGPTGNAYVYNAKTGALITTLRALRRRQLHQRRRRHEAGRVVHGLVQARPLPGPARPERPPGRAFGVHDGHARGDYVQGIGVQRQRHRRDGERQDARLRPVGHREALHRRRERRRTHDRARARRERAERRRDPARRQDALRRAERARRHGEDRARARICGAGGSFAGSPIPRTSTSRRRSPSSGSRLYAVNARFDFPSPDASTEYWITKLGK